MPKDSRLGGRLRTCACPAPNSSVTSLPSLPASSPLSLSCIAEMFYTSQPFVAGAVHCRPDATQSAAREVSCLGWRVKAAWGVREGA